MLSGGQYSLRSPAVKRLMREAQELHEPTELFYAQPLEEFWISRSGTSWGGGPRHNIPRFSDNLFEWHFTIRGPADTEFADGIYHGRIILPPEYPMKPPSIILLTPTGRFEIGKKICLSISGYHPESWQPSWSIRTAMLAIIGFMPTHGSGAIGALDYTPAERKKIAQKSRSWTCDDCGDISEILKPLTEASKGESDEAKELASQIAFQEEKPNGEQQKEKPTPTPTTTTSSATTTCDANFFLPSSSPSPGPTTEASPPLPATRQSFQAQVLAYQQFLTNYYFCMLQQQRQMMMPQQQPLWPPPTSPPAAPEVRQRRADPAPPAAPPRPPVLQPRADNLTRFMLILCMISTALLLFGRFYGLVLLGRMDDPPPE